MIIHNKYDAQAAYDTAYYRYLMFGGEDRLTDMLRHVTLYTVTPQLARAIKATGYTWPSQS